MAVSTWPTVVAADFAADQSIETTDAQAIKARGEVLRQTPIQLAAAGPITAGTTNWKIEPAGFMLNTLLRVLVELTVTGTGTLQLILKRGTTTIATGGAAAYAAPLGMYEVTLQLDEDDLSPEEQQLGHTDGEAHSLDLVVTGTGTFDGIGPSAWVEDL